MTKIFELEKITLYIKSLLSKKELPFYDNFNTIELYRTFEKVKEIVYFLKPNNKIYILDIGCGSGYITSLLCKIGFKCIGLSPQANEKIWKGLSLNYNAKFLIARGEMLPFKENIFDAVIIFGVLEHIREDKNFCDKKSYDIEFLREIKRVLKNNSKLFIYNIPNKFSLTENLCKLLCLWHHKYRYTLARLKLLAEVGHFKIERIYSRGILPSLKIGKVIKNKTFAALYNKFDCYLCKLWPIKFLAQNYNLVLTIRKPDLIRNYSASS